MLPRTVLLIGALLLALPSFAETITCSYPAWSPPGKPKIETPVVVELVIEEKTADVRWAGRFDFAQKYRVLENTSYGLVVTSTYAAPEAAGMSPTIGAYTFIIDRKTGAMRYGGFFSGERNPTASEGTCIFRK